MKKAVIILMFLCAIPAFGLIIFAWGLGQVRGDHAENMAMLSLLSLATIAGSIAVVGGIFLIGKVARVQRQFLLLSFALGLKIVQIATSCIVIASGIILMGAIFYGEVLLFDGRYHPKLILGIGIGILYGVYAIVKGTFRGSLPVRFEIARKVDATAASELWSLVTNIAKKLETDAPKNIIAGLDHNFYVTEQPIKTLDGEINGRTLFVSLAAMRTLTKAELQAILGHEMAHFSGDDVKYARAFYPIYRTTAQTIANLQATESAVSLPAMILMNLFFDAFAEAENSLSRSRELVADAKGSEIASKEAMARSLVKIHTYGIFWGVVVKKNHELLAEGKLLSNLSEIFANITKDTVDSELIQKNAETSVSHPFDSHPKLSERMKNLEVSVESTTNDVLKLPEGENRAISMIPEFEKIEIELSEADAYVYSERQKAIAAAMAAKSQQKAA